MASTSMSLFHVEQCTTMCKECVWEGKPGTAGEWGSPIHPQNACGVTGGVGMPWELWGGQKGSVPFNCVGGWQCPGWNTVGWWGWGAGPRGRLGPGHTQWHLGIHCGYDGPGARLGGQGRGVLGGGSREPATGRPALSWSPGGVGMGRYTVGAGSQGQGRSKVQPPNGGGVVQGQ